MNFIDVITDNNNYIAHLWNPASHTTTSTEFGESSDSCKQDKYARLADSPQGKLKRKFDEQSHNDLSQNRGVTGPGVTSPSMCHISSHCDFSADSEKRFKSGHESCLTNSVYQHDSSLNKHLNHPSETSNVQQPPTTTSFERHLNSVTKNVSPNNGQNSGRDCLLQKNLFGSESKQQKSKKRYEWVITKIEPR